MQIVRLEVKSSQNVNDPAVMEAMLQLVGVKLFVLKLKCILSFVQYSKHINMMFWCHFVQIQQKMKDRGIERNTRVGWRVQPDGNVFSPKLGGKDAAEKRNPNKEDCSEF